MNAQQLLLKGIAPGTRVQVRCGVDEDEFGNDRNTNFHTPGWIDSPNTVAVGGQIESWNVHFENGAAMVLDNDELLDSRVCKLGEPITMREHLLRIVWADDAELTYMDDPILSSVLALADRAGDLLSRIEKLNAIAGGLYD